MKLLLAKLCEYACKLENQRHSMLGIFDDIRVPSLPIEHPAFFICVQVEFDAAEAGQPWHIEAILVDPDAKQLFRADLQGTVPEPQGGILPVKLFAQISVPPVRFENAGDYRLDVILDGRIAGEERVPVFVVRGY